MRRRILLATLLAVAVTTITLGLPLGFSAMRLVEGLTLNDLGGRAQQIATRLDNQVASGKPVNLEPVKVALPPHGRLVVHTQGHEYAWGPNPGPNALSETVPMVQDGTVTLSQPSGPVRTRQAQWTGVIVLLAVLSAGIGMLVAVITARRLAEPLRHVADRAVRLGAGDFRPDARRYSVPELDRVSKALDTSAQALSQLVQRERELVGDVSHQLRSRLTALQLRLEALSTTEDQSVAEDAGAALEQSEQLSQVLDDLLANATAARAVGAEPLDISETLPAVTDGWRDPLRAAGRALRIRVPEGLLARATPARLRESVGVLLDNALRHGDGTVHVTARQGNGTVIVSVGDSGTVPEKLVPYLFERGFSSAGSSGVGLALARALIESDGGRLELSSAQPTTFELFLRTARADDIVHVDWDIDSTPR